jgi:hypothetical protein
VHTRQSSGMPGVADRSKLGTIRRGIRSNPTVHEERSCPSSSPR